MSNGLNFFYLTKSATLQLKNKINVSKSSLKIKFCSDLDNSCTIVSPRYVVLFYIVECCRKWDY